MRQREMRRRAIRQHHLLHEGFDVHFEIAEIADIALRGSRSRRDECPVRASRSSPPRNRDRADRAPSRSIFDLLAAAGEEQTCPCVGRRRPAREAQFAPSGVLMVPETTFSGTGLAGIETSVMAGPVGEKD